MAQLFWKTVDVAKVLTVRLVGLDGVSLKMESGSSVGLIYGLEFQCRSLCSVAADTDNVSFLVGTQGLKLPNQIHHIQLREDTQTLTKNIYQHSCGEIWEIASSYSDPSLFSTRHSQVDGGGLKVGGSVWRMSQDNSPDRYISGVGQELELICHLRSENGRDEAEHISWLPSPESSKWPLQSYLNWINSASSEYSANLQWTALPYYIFALVATSMNEVALS